MLRVEKKWNPDPSYMLQQKKIDETIRSTLVDWLIQIHYNFKLWPETLFLTVNVIDRYCSLHEISKKEVQLVGIAALLMITKYEEIYPPTLKDFIYITGDNYTSEQILEMEWKILYALDFDISQCTSFRFLERFAKLSKIDNVTFFLSQYMLELGLLDSKMSQFPQSLQAIAAIYTAKKYMLHSERSTHKSFAEHSHQQSSSLILSDLNVPQYQTEQVKSCAKCFNQLAKLIQRSKLQNIVKKFKTPKFFEVARIIVSHGQHQTSTSDKRHQSFQSLPSNGKTARETKSIVTATGTVSSSNTKNSGGESRQKESSSKQRHISMPAASRGSRISGNTRENSISMGGTTPNTASHP